MNDNDTTLPIPIDEDTEIRPLVLFNDLDALTTYMDAQNEMNELLFHLVLIYREATESPHADIGDALDDTIEGIESLIRAYGGDPDRFAPDTDTDTDADPDADSEANSSENDVMADGGFVTNAPTQTAIRGMDRETGTTEWVDLDGEPITNEDCAGCRCGDRAPDQDANAGVIPQGTLIDQDGDGDAGTDMSDLKPTGGSSSARDGVPGNLRDYRERSRSSVNANTDDLIENVETTTDTAAGTRAENAREVRVVDPDDPRHDPDNTMIERVYAVSPNSAESRHADEHLRVVDDPRADPIALVNLSNKIQDDDLMERETADTVAKLIR